MSIHAQVRAFWTFLAALTLVRFAVAATTSLSPDEAYYWVWSHAPALSYYDHPPMVALWIRGGTAIFGDTAIGVRSFGPIAALVTTYAIVQATRELTGNLSVGLNAGLIFNATLMAGIGAVIMTPDTPLLMFWSLAAWALVRLDDTGKTNWWFAVGAAAGFALLSKYTAVFLGIGIIAWLALSPIQRHWLRDWRLWAAGAVALGLFAPVIAWNAGHDWVSVLKQGDRLQQAGNGLSLKFFGELIGGQLGLATPLIFLAAIVSSVYLVAQSVRTGASGLILIACLLVPGSLVFVAHSLFDRVQGDWPAILYPAIAVAAAGFGPPWLSKIRTPAVILGFAITAVVYVQASLASLPIPPKADMTLKRMGGWQEFAAELETRYRAAGAKALISEDYGVASALAFTMPADVKIIAIGPRWRHFDLPKIDPKDLAPSPALLIVDRRSDYSKSAFADLRPVGEITRARNGRIAESYRLFDARDWTDREIAVELPHPKIGLPNEATIAACAESQCLR